MRFKNSTGNYTVESHPSVVQRRPYHTNRVNMHVVVFYKKTCFLFFVFVKATIFLT